METQICPHLGKAEEESSGGCEDENTDKQNTSGLHEISDPRGEVEEAETPIHSCGYGIALRVNAEEYVAHSLRGNASQGHSISCTELRLNRRVTDQLLNIEHSHQKAL